uniref:Uncharacterized protein n=1 Tax=Bursaphelenchus xylophilus TaxID=6326 RepID=A0A1I7SGM2_BURXY
MVPAKSLQQLYGPASSLLSLARNSLGLASLSRRRRTALAVQQAEGQEAANDSERSGKQKRLTRKHQLHRQASGEGLQNG